MSRKRTCSLTILSAAGLVSLSLLLAGCSLGNSEKKLADAADAVNAAIEQDLSMDSYEFTVTTGAYFNDTKHEGLITTYICVAEDGGRDYYVTSTPTDQASTVTIEHKIMGDSHYHRIFDKNKGEYHILSDMAEQTDDHTEPPENGWMLESTGDENGNEYYKGRLWIYNHRISPKDFTEVSRRKEDGKTFITLNRSTEQPDYLPLPAKLLRDEQLQLQEQETASQPNNAETRKYTAETLEAAIDADGRLLTIEYKITYESADGNPFMTLEDEEINSITKYSYVNLSRFNDASVAIPE